MAALSYDVAVIGSGPGGYVCALRAAQLGLRVAIIEAQKNLGGTCLNVGCIPSKALLHASAHYAGQAGLKDMGIASAPKLNLKTMQAYKAAGIEANVNGVSFLMKKNKITVHHGAGRILEDGTIKTGKETITAKHIVIATGATNMDLPGVAIDEKRISSSTGALDWGEVPSSLLIVGAGVIGLELGSVWARLGAKVEVVELGERIAMGADAKMAATLQKSLTKQGLQFLLGHRVQSAKAGAKTVAVEIVDTKNKSQTKTYSHVLVAIGRRAYTDGLGLAEAGIAQDKSGRIVIDGRFQTSRPNIYAIGDVVDGAMLAHKASEEGVVLAERLAGQASGVNYATIPNVVYTAPELAWVGASEDELKAADIHYRVGQFPLLANGRAKINQQTDGLVKLLSDAVSGRVLGAHILAPHAGDLIGEMVIAMECGASSEAIARAVHAHPTLSEAIKEAALAANERALHM